MTVDQLSVATRTTPYTRNEEKILAVLESYPEGATPKLLSRETGINVNTIKSILPKLSAVKKILRGLYKVEKGGDGTSISGEDFGAWNFHNLVLFSPAGYPDMSQVFDFGLGRVSMSIVKGRASCRLSSDWPLNVSAISFVACVFADWISVDWRGVLVSTVEFNRDFVNLRLDGAKSLTVDSLVDNFKAYQKRRGLRLEHKTKVPFSVENLGDLLSQPPLSVDAHVKLQSQAEQLSRLVEATSNNTQMIFKLVEKLGGD